MKLKNIKDYVLLVFGVRADELRGFRLLTFLARRWLPGYRFTWPELAWFRDTALGRVLARFDEADGFNAHRRLMLRELSRLTAGVPGDTAECGVYRGCGSYLIMEVNARLGGARTHHVFDSFAGLSAPGKEDGRYWTEGDLAVGLAEVQGNLSDLGQVAFYQGWIPDRFAEVAERHFAFVHVDVDLYEPTRDSVAFFYERLSPGGVFVCDDYGFLTCPGATAAMDEFLEGKPEKVVLLPGGGGFFIKGCVTVPS